MPQAFLYLLRHAPTALNEKSDERARGWSPAPIDPKRGPRIAEAAFQELASRRIQLIVTSDIQRALDTARIGARKLGVPVYPTELLRPWNIGELEGQPSAAVAPVLLFHRENPEDAPSGGESFAAFCARAMHAIRDLVLTAAAPPYPRMAVVTHKSVLLLVRPTIEGVPPDPKDREAPDPGRIVTLKIAPDGVTAHGL